MSLADELLADLEEMDGGQGSSSDQNNISKEEPMETDEISLNKSLFDKNSVHSVAKLKDSILLEETMKKIEFYTKHQRKSRTC